MGAVVDGTLDFGAEPGSSEASVTIDAPGCLATSHAEAFVQVSSNAANGPEQHKVLAALGKFICEPTSGQITVTCKVDGGFYAQDTFNVSAAWV